jgi:hypothetical protein
MAQPEQPDAASREQLLDVLGELVVRGGAGPLLAPPVEPGTAAFPEPWAPTKPGVELLLRRILWHAGIDRDVDVEDRRAAGAPPTDRTPATRVELFELRGRSARFALGLIGRDDIAGTLVHEVGVAYAAAHRPEEADPYRTAEPPVISIDPDRDLERGSIATVYLGLGVLAANAAYQQYTREGVFTGGNTPIEYDVLRAGHVPMSALAYLLAVQATVRGERGAPRGLGPPQRDEVEAWLSALRGHGAELRERLGIASDLRGAARPEVVPFGEVSLAEARVARTAFRWRTNRGGIGLIAGAVLGLGVAAAVGSRGAAFPVLFGSAAVGHVVGRRVLVPRCSACAAIVATNAQTCTRCGAALRGDIARLADRLEAEEQLEEETP